LSDEIPENENKEQRRKRLARERQRRYLAKKTFKENIGVNKNLEFPQVKMKPRDNMGFDDLDKILRETFGDLATQQHVAESKQLEREFNELAERHATRNVCPFCKSSVCVCREE